MAPVVDGMREPLAATPIRPAAVPLVGNVDARPLTHPDDLRQELLDQICASVRWVDVVAALTGSGVAAFYEVGPGKILAGLIGRFSQGGPDGPGASSVATGSGAGSGTTLEAYSPPNP